MSYLLRRPLGADVVTPIPASTSTGVRSPTSTRTEVRSPTSTRTEVRSPTSTEVRSPTRTSTSTEAYTAGNVTVTGGAGAGATTSVTITNPESGRRIIARRHPVSSHDNTVSPYLASSAQQEPDAMGAFDFAGLSMPAKVALGAGALGAAWLLYKAVR
jgi:hypothetical protein